MENILTIPTDQKRISISAHDKTIYPSLISNNNLLVSLCLSHLVVLALMFILDRDMSPEASLIGVTFSGSVGIYLFYVLYLKKVFGKIAFRIVFSAFLLRVITGILHYILVMDPNYFNNYLNYTFFWDFKWMHESLLQVSSIWQQYGFGSKLPNSYWISNKNAYITAYNALLYYLSGPYSLNIAPWNSLHQIYAGCIIGVIAIRYGATQKQSILVLVIATFQPFGFISNLMVRDYVGQMWIALAVYLVITVKHRKIIWWLISFPFACFLAYSVRQPYLLVIIFGFSITYFFQKKLQLHSFFFILATIILVLVWFGLAEKINSLALGRFQNSDVLSFGRIAQFPLRLLRAIMGPFPWFNFFDKPSAYQYMPADYLQCVLNLAMMMNAIPIALKDWKQKRLVDPAFVFGMLFLFSGIFASGVHATYVSLGMVFFLPIGCRSSKTKWIQSIGISFGFFIITNIIYRVLALKGSAIVMGVTGY